MPLLQITADGAGTRVHGTPRLLENALSEGLGSPGPIVIMVHGYKFSPGDPRHCPHRHILSLNPPTECWKALSWPRALGFGGGFSDEGLGIAFGWPARGTIWQAYARAERAGLALADLIAALRRAAPGRPVHLFCHSLGARVALSALPHVAQGAVGRIILLNAAEFGAHARSALSSPAGLAAQIVNITSRENDLFDFLLERLVSAPEWGDRTLAHAMPDRPNTLTLQLDHAATLAALNARGFAIAPATGRICHWSAYLRPGVFALYRALLRRPDSLTLQDLRTILPDRPQPRWSRVMPVPDIKLPLPMGRRAPL